MDLPSHDNNGVAGSWGVSNVGTIYTYTFTPTDATCYMEFSFEITITGNSMLILPASYLTSYCEETIIEFPILTDDSGNIITGEWSTSSINNTTSATYIFTPEGCFQQYTLDIIITPKPTTSIIQYTP